MIMVNGEALLLNLAADRTCAVLLIEYSLVVVKGYAEPLP
jgi:hypothetical protein